MEQQAWHALAADDVTRIWETPVDGLTAEEAAARLQRYGLNRMVERQGVGWLTRFVRQFQNPLIYALLASSVVSGFLSHWVDTCVILAVVFLNAVIGVIQEGRAENSLEAIRRMIDPQATVWRDNHRLGVAAWQLVPGDRVLLAAGDRVPADLRLVETHQLRIDEAILTGESLVASKNPALISAEAPLGDRTGMAYSGTLVVAGTAEGIVVATANDTELGRINRLLGEVVELQTPLTRQLNQFATRITAFILLASVLIFLFAVGVRDYAWADAFMMVVGLAVAAIPEGLPAVVTITLAVGVQRMAARQAIVRVLPAVETLGSVSTICSDKTGTLTRNEMMVQAVAVHASNYTVEGTGYGPVGALLPEGAAVSEDDRLVQALARAAVLCNDADVALRDGEWVAHGDPTEAALIAFARKAGLEPDTVRAEHPRIHEIPFDGERQFMLTRHAGVGDTPNVMVKGAPERVFQMVVRVAVPDGFVDFEPAEWLDRTHQLAARGLRVLALASGHEPDGVASSLRDDATGDGPQGLTLLGLVGLIDPPREAARLAIAECQRAGIKVKMITGDHAVTAAAIARQLGMADTPVVLVGAELDHLTRDEMILRARTTDVFARTTPEHKLRLVEALQSDGSVVAMTGDGVNDAPALKRADVGVAMGINGTEVAKEASQMVLADDNFASIVDAVREGRTVYDNITKVIAWTLPTNGGETVAILAALFLGFHLPVTPVQILWINLITSVALGLTLVLDPAASNVMSRPPRAIGAPLLDRHLMGQVLLLCVLFSVGAFSVFFGVLTLNGNLDHARTLVVHTIVCMEIGYLLSVRLAPSDKLNWRALWATPVVRLGIGVVMLAQLAFVYVPPFQHMFTTTPLGLWDWLAAVGIGGLVFGLVELEKRLRVHLVKTSV
jgi:magnesium-transporting ATPase (P-type)